jgi:tRNA dimethylallyltransferase
LAQIDSFKAGQMNSSDKKNPRRLVRAIEVATWKVGNFKKEHEIEGKKNNLDVLEIGLSASEKDMAKRIKTSVNKRLKKGIKSEIENLLKSHINWNMQSMSSMGYREWKDFFEGNKPETVVVKEWESEEIKYIKRQITWFKKDKRINWFDITGADYPENVEIFVKKWHNTSNA